MTFDQFKDRIIFTIQTHPEDTLPEEHFDDPELAKWVEDQYDRGNTWQWCTVEVRGNFMDLQANDHLGCCSYETQEEFMGDAYYQDMVNTVAKELWEKAHAIKDMLTTV